MFSVYVLYSASLDRYYIGYTTDIDKRIERHNAGRSTFTKNGIPWKLVYIEIFLYKQEAYKREFEIKSYKGGVAFKKLIGGVA